MKTGGIETDVESNTEKDIKINKDLNILDRIVIEKVKEVKKIKEKRRSLEDKLTTDNITLIAEIKKASPSKGIISVDFDPEKQLNYYIEAGADAVSVLTDEKFFQGSSKILAGLREKTDLPLLRKDFIIDPIQVYESFFLGADLILLISSILKKDELGELITITHSLGMEALVEVHNLNDLDKAIDANAKILGINNRDLTDFTVKLENTAIIIDELNKRDIRDDFYIISESGIKCKEDINYLKELGVNGVLVGESLMKASDPEGKINELFN